MLLNRSLQRFGMCRTHILVDIEAIRFIADGEYFCTELTEYRRTNFVTGAMSTIEDNPQASQRLIGRVGRFTKFDVTADRIIDATRFTQLSRIRHNNRLID